MSGLSFDNLLLLKATVDEPKPITLLIASAAVRYSIAQLQNEIR